jgi:multidrug transporter EmrE-like cation transporter
MGYKHNGFQKAAFWCWGIGAAIILICGAIIFVSFSHASDSDAPFIAIGFLIAGIVLLATGGTLHKIGSGRERKP